MLYLAARGISSAQNAESTERKQKSSKKNVDFQHEKSEATNLQESPETIHAIRMFSWQFLQEFQMCGIPRFIKHQPIIGSRAPALRIAFFHHNEINSSTSGLLSHSHVAHVRGLVLRPFPYLMVMLTSPSVRLEAFPFMFNCLALKEI